MLDEHLRFLICPHCGKRLTRDGGTLVCHDGHTFDVARQGYVSLLPPEGRTVPGDTTTMVAARERFLNGGHFAPIMRAVSRTGTRELDRQAVDCDASRRCVVDLGAGTGDYLGHLSEQLHEPYGLVAIDVSKAAARRAARMHPRLAAVVGDTRRVVPVASNCAAVVIDAFAPREPSEIDRLLTPGGSVIVVLPRSEHLSELVHTMGLLAVDPCKRERTDRTLTAAAELVDEERVSYGMSLGHDDVADLVRMGPSAWHQSEKETRGKLASLPEPLRVTASVSVLTYRRPGLGLGSVPWTADSRDRP